MRTRALRVLAAILAMIPTVVAAQPPAQSRGAVMSGMTLQPRKPMMSQPYVFRIPTTATQRANTPGKPTVVCGLTVIDADPTFDAAMRRPAKRPGDTTKFTIKAIQPTVCTRNER
jgi:hypothetical protein